MSANHAKLGAAWANRRRQVLKAGSVCWLCNRPLDFDAPPRSRWSPSVDHEVPLATLAALPKADRQKIALDVRYLHPAHYGCNSRRGAGRRRKVQMSVGSRRW